LMARKGEYFKLYNMQFSNDNNSDIHKDSLKPPVE
jgi:hypothetical protein